MNRTKRRLMGVTFSVLLLAAGGGINPPSAKATVLIVNQLAGPDPKKVKEVVVTISELLRNVPKQKAMTLNEILAKRPDLERNVVEAAIKELVEKKQIWTIGTGSKYSPYRYYYDKNRTAKGR